MVGVGDPILLVSALLFFLPETFPAERCFFEASSQQWVGDKLLALGTTFGHDAIERFVSTNEQYWWPLTQAKHRIAGIL